MYGLAVMLSVPAPTTGKNIDKMGEFPLENSICSKTQSVPQIVSKKSNPSYITG